MLESLPARVYANEKVENESFTVWRAIHRWTGHMTSEWGKEGGGDIKQKEVHEAKKLVAFTHFFPLKKLKTNFTLYRARYLEPNRLA